MEVDARETHLGLLTGASRNQVYPPTEGRRWAPTSGVGWKSPFFCLEFFLEGI